MQRRLISVILFALLAAAASSTVLYKIISVTSQPTVRAATMQIPVAVRELSAGSMVGPDDLRAVELPAVGDSVWILRREDIVGRGLLAPVGKGEPFAEARLAAKGAGAGFASGIPPGMRAAAIHVDQQNGLANVLTPGTHVDVISTGAEGGPNGQTMVTRTLLQNIEVYSAGQGGERDTKGRANAAQSFNLLVSPQQAEVLSRAVAQSRIELVLRNPLDKGNFPSTFLPQRGLAAGVPVPRAARSTVGSVPVQNIASAPIPVPASTPSTVEVIHGVRKTVTVVGAAGEAESGQ